MKYLLKIPQKEFELICIKLLTDECINCDMTKCRRSNCVFRNHTLGKYTKFNGNKHWIYYFLHHPELEWKFPDGEKGKWCIHHIDLNHSNDNEDNLQLITVSDHTKLHRLISVNPFEVIGNDGLNVAQRFSKERKVSTAKSNNERVSKGIHQWQGDRHWSKQSEKYKLLLSFLQKLDKGSTQITKELTESIGYSTKTNLLRAIILIVNKNFPEIKIKTFGTFKHRKDYLVKE